MHFSRNLDASSLSVAALYPMVFAAAISTPGNVSFPTPQSLTVEYPRQDPRQGEPERRSSRGLEA